MITEVRSAISYSWDIRIDGICESTSSGKEPVVLMAFSGGIMTLGETIEEDDHIKLMKICRQAKSHPPELT